MQSAEFVLGDRRIAISEEEEEQRSFAAVAETVEVLGGPLRATGGSETERDPLSPLQSAAHAVCR